jgi:hypothetical protein
MFLKAHTQKIAGIVFAIIVLAGCPTPTSSADGTDSQGNPAPEPTPCERLAELCPRCRSDENRALCYQAVNLEEQSTCQEYLDAGTFETDGAICTN